jgi:drug/metabolite transporter (DMT)-like permease
VATMTTTQGSTTATAYDGHPALRPFIFGASILDAALGIVCLALASRLADWLALSETSVLVTGGVFLLAAVVGDVTLLRRRLDVRWIIEANLVFAAWCLAVVGFDSPNALGVVLLVGSAVAAAATALAERRLS